MNSRQATNITIIMFSRDFNRGLKFIFSFLLLCCLPLLLKVSRYGLTSKLLPVTVNTYIDRQNTSNRVSFEKDQPKLIVILAYHRTGSTFLGDSFNEHPDVFYMFEPLDSLYSSLYGTSMGWNVPTDIRTFRNGSERTLSTLEELEIFKFLRSLLTCDVDALPTELLINQYMLYFFTTPFSTGQQYVPCALKFNNQIQQCKDYAPTKYCGHRFGEKAEERLEECHTLLTNKSFRQSHREGATFEKYLNCSASLRKFINMKCVSHLKQACHSRQTRIVKLVRGSMKSMERLFQEFPNFRVIHLIRDPRAVSLSRRYFHSSGRSQFTELNRNQTILREAILFCRIAVEDLKTGLELERKFPGKIKLIVYDDLIRNVMTYVAEIFNFLDLKLLPVTLSNFQKLASTNSTSNLYDKWKNEIVFQTNKDILSVCKEFFDISGYNWEM